MSLDARSGMFQRSQRASCASGQPISQLMSQALANPELISLAAGFVDDSTLPVEETALALDELFADFASGRRALQYGSTIGDPGLRSALLEWTLPDAAARPSTLNNDRVLITSGSNQLLHLVAEVLLDPGDIVLCASPTYLVFLGTLANLGARTIGLASDDQGLIPESLEETLRALQASGEIERVKAIYIVPYFDNPRGVTMPSERVAAVIEIAKRWSIHQQIFVIADEAYRELRYSGDDTPSALSLDADGETVVSAGTFSKSFSPGVRIGWGILPSCLIGPVCDVKGNIDFGSPNLNQLLMLRIIENGVLPLHLERIRVSYETKLAAMLSAAEQYLRPFPDTNWTCPDGGLYVWAQIAAAMETGPGSVLWPQAIEEGVLYVPGQYCFAAEGVAAATNTLRLSFGVQSVDRIDAGVAALARAIEYAHRRA